MWLLTTKLWLSQISVNLLRATNPNQFTAALGFKLSRKIWKLLSKKTKGQWERKTDFSFCLKQITVYIFKTNVKGETYHTKQLTQKLGGLENITLPF